MTKTENQKSNFQNQITWILFALVIIAIYFFALDVPLVGPDEPRYSQVAREMFERNDWVTTTLGDFNWFEKPALLYWLQIVFYNIFGVSEFSARFGSALFGLGTIFSLYLLGKNVKIKPLNDEKATVSNSEFANWLMLITASSLGLLVFARGASFDIVITFPIAASLVGFFIFETATKKSFINLPLIAFYFFIGLGLLGKGLIGIVFPFAIVAFYYVLRWKLPSKTFFVSLLWGMILSVLVASSWYLPMYLRHGWEFIDEFFIQHHFQRYTSNKYKHPQPFWFFWAIFPLFIIPWIPFFIISIFKAGKEKSKEGFWKKFRTRELKPKKQTSEIRTFAIAWMLVPLVFFSLSGSKLPGYILPALPGACILTALYVFQFVQKNSFRKYALQGVALLMFATVAVILQFLLPHYALQDTTKGLIESANQKGYTNEKVLNVPNIIHNAEFYAVGRLSREPDGTQKRFKDAQGLVNFLEKENIKTALVLTSHKNLHKLTKSNLIETKVLDKNDELNIALVKLK